MGMCRCAYTRAQRATEHCSILMSDVQASLEALVQRLEAVTTRLEATEV